MNKYYIVLYVNKATIIFNVMSLSLCSKVSTFPDLRMQNLLHPVHTANSNRLHDANDIKIQNKNKRWYGMIPIKRFKRLKDKTYTILFWISSKANIMQEKCFPKAPCLCVLQQKQQLPTLHLAPWNTLVSKKVWNVQQFSATHSLVRLGQRVRPLRHELFIQDYR